MSLSKEYLRIKVVQAIEIMPSNAIVVREISNNYNEKDGYGKVADLKGVLYNTQSKFSTIVLKDSGETEGKEDKVLLVDYNDKSKLIRKSDIVLIENKGYKVLELGEEFEVYYEFKLEEYGIVYKDEMIQDDDGTYIVVEDYYGW